MHELFRFFSTFVMFITTHSLFETLQYLHFLKGRSSGAGSGGGAVKGVAGTDRAQPARAESRRNAL